MIPLLGTPGVPYFSGANVSDFYTRYEAMAADYSLNTRDTLSCLPRYCELMIGDHICTMEEWINSDWDALKEALLEEYRKENSYQQKMSRKYLEALKNKGCKTVDELRVYCRQYHSISAYLVEKGTLEKYIQAVWFLEGLPDAIRTKVIRKHGVDLEKPDMLKFKTFLKSVTSYYTAEQTAQEFSRTTGDGEVDLDDLVDHFQQQPHPTKAERLAPPVIPQPMVPTVVSASVKPVVKSPEEPEWLPSFIESFGMMALLVRTIGEAVQGLAHARVGDVHIGASQPPAQSPLNMSGGFRPPALSGIQGVRFEGCIFCHAADHW